MIPRHQDIEFCYDYKYHDYYYDATIFDDADYDTDGIKLRIGEKTLNCVMDDAITVDPRQLCDIQDCFDMAIAYWCESVYADIDPHDPRNELEVYDPFESNGKNDFNISEHLSRGGMLKLKGSFHNTRYDLTRRTLTAGIIEALYAMCEQGFCDAKSLIDDKILSYDDEEDVYFIDFSEFDYSCEFADLAVQFAVFGEQLYSRNFVKTAGHMRVYVPLPKDRRL